MTLRDLGYELFCLLLPKSSAAAKVTLQMRVCDCGECDGCWRFTGDHDGSGYGVVTGPFGTRATRAHVALWIYHHGPLAQGQELGHRERIHPGHRDCCNPSHLEPRPAPAPTTGPAGPDEDPR